EAWLVGRFSKSLYELPGLDPAAATDLTERILKRYGVAHYRSDEAHRDDLRQLLKLLDGYPLALEVVLANLQRQTPGEVLAAFTGGEAGVDTPASRGDHPGRPLWEDKTKSILRCVEYSHSNLSPEAQALLGCLAPFTGVINTGWLGQYTAQLKAQPPLAGLPYDQWDGVLGEAKNWGLLTPHEAGGGYLRLQPILPYFLRQRELELEGARAAVEAAFRAHYDEVGGYLAGLIQSKKPDERQLGQALIGLEYENLMTALKSALATQTNFFTPYDALYHYLDAKQDQQNRRELGELVWRFKDNFQEQKLTTEINSHFIQVLDRLANVYLVQQLYELATTTYKNTLELLNQIKNVPDEWRGKAKASTYHQLGVTVQAQRQWETAVRHYQRALQIKIEFNDRYSQAGTYHQL
ncbi:MAG: tetratricopeptide repeat protein, partial [Chloroflexi bacterium]|nr:tetratricopeptide repeat protein [Chloroflexota bacterium]